MHNKIIKVALAIFSFLFISNAYAAIDDTHVTLTNNTDEPIVIHGKLTTTDTDFVKGTNWDNVEDTLEPYESRQVLWFGRNRGLKNAVDYDYELSANRENDTDQLILRFHVTGSHYYGSVIQHSMQLPQHNSQLVLQQKGLEHYDSQFWGSDYTVHARRMRSPTNLFTDVHVVIEKHEKQPVHNQGDNTLDVLTYNTQLQPFYGSVVNDLNQPDERLLDIIPAITHYDVVIFQELFDHKLRNTLTSQMTVNYPYHTDVVGSSTQMPWTGGVMIFSKWPIEKQDQIVYIATTGTDQYAAKGVGYARINKNGKYYNVFGTHLESGDEVDDVRVRRKQLAELENFIDRQTINKSEPVLIGGDMNIDDYSLEAPTLYNSLNAEKITTLGHQYSSDGFVNTMNVDKDRQRIDYVLNDKRYLTPKTAYNRVFVLRAFADEKMWPKFDLSDHFPVESHFEF